MAWITVTTSPEDLAVTDRAMAFTLASSSVDLGDERAAIELLAVARGPFGAGLYSRAEIDACLTRAIEAAREIRQEMEAIDYGK